jgi:hypothetical protein
MSRVRIWLRTIQRDVLLVICKLYLRTEVVYMRRLKINNMEQYIVDLRRTCRRGICSVFNKASRYNIVLWSWLSK